MDQKVEQVQQLVHELERLRRRLSKFEGIRASIRLRYGNLNAKAKYQRPKQGWLPARLVIEDIELDDDEQRLLYEGLGKVQVEYREQIAEIERKLRGEA